MRTYSDCLACIVRMIFDSIKLATSDEKEQSEIFFRILDELKNHPTEKSPPEIYGELYAIIKKMSGNEDPYKEIKRKCNDLILEHSDYIGEKIKDSKDPLMTAIELSIAGNIIDYGIDAGFDIEDKIDEIIKKEERIINKESEELFAYSAFLKDLEKAKNVLFLCDNAGEIVLDTFLLKELKKRGLKITAATRSVPILNDIMKDEAIYCGLNKMVDKIITSGSYFPGTVLPKSDPEFLKIIKSADLIIAKGQGNYETMYGEKEIKDLPIYFLFMAKCETVVNEVNKFLSGCKLNNILLLTNNRRFL